jgi:hypothetical protein
MRARTSLFTSLSLANYSEFGLIVGAMAAGSGWLSGDWLVIIAIALSVTFILAAPLNTAAVNIYERMQKMLNRFETDRRLTEELPADPGDARAVVVGMGRVGTQAYDKLEALWGETILGLDYDVDVVDAQVAAGRNVVEGDPADPEFVARLNRSDQIELILLATGETQSDLAVTRSLRQLHQHRKIAAVANWPEEDEALREAGADLVFSIYEDVGADFAQRVHGELFSTSGMNHSDATTR